jgi:4-amino-4-deoxy-L-arabinose transferase-like glycosyltransferase
MKRFTWVESLVVVLLLLVVSVTSMGSIPFNPDEADWIATSDYFERFIQADFSQNTWYEMYWTLTHPPLTRYIIGMGRLAGGYHPEGLNHPWVYAWDEQTNIAAGNLPDEDLLWWSRLPMALLAGLAGWLWYRLLRREVGRLAAYAWVGVYVFSPYLHGSLWRALSETPLFLGVTLVVLATRRLVQYWKQPEQPAGRRLVGALLAGAACGLTATAKINGFSLAAGPTLVCLLAVLSASGLSRRERFSQAIRGIGGVSLTALLVFILINPYLYPDPLTRTGRMLKFRLEEMATQQQNFPEARLSGVSQRLQVEPQRILGELMLPSFNGAAWLNGALVLAGLVVVVWIVWHWQKTERGAAALAFLAVGVFAVGPALLTPLDWERYYLLPVLFATFLQVTGLAWLVGLIRRQLPVKSKEIITE